MLKLITKPLLVGLTLLLIAASSSLLAQQVGSPRDQVPRSFSQLNQSFLSLYHAQDPLLEPRLPLIIVVRSESMSAIEPARTSTYPLAPEISEIKSALHATLGFQGIMTLAAHQPSDLVWGRVGQLRDDLVALETLLPRSAAPSTVREAVQINVRTMLQLAEKALTERAIDHAQVVAVLTDLRPAIWRTVDQLGHVAMAQMKAVFGSIRDRVSPSVWDQAIVVVPGPATARIDNLAVAAAVQALGPEQLGRRIFYSEGIYSDEAIRLYAKMLMRDQQLSSMLFDDPYRMWRDLFANVSRQYVNEAYFTPLAQRP